VSWDGRLLSKKCSLLSRFLQGIQSELRRSTTLGFVTGCLMLGIARDSLEFQAESDGDD
jgi:hypothetical protein